MGWVKGMAEKAAFVTNPLGSIVGGFIGFFGLPGLLLSAATVYYYDGIPWFVDGKLDVAEEERDNWHSAADDYKLALQRVTSAKAKLTAKYQKDLAMAEADRLDAVADSIRAARRADHANQEAADFRRAADGYARRMRIAVKQAGAKPVRSDGDDIPPSDNGPGEGAGFVIITREQFDGFVINTERLIKAHGFYKDQEREGRAVAMPEPQFGEQ